MPNTVGADACISPQAGNAQMCIRDRLKAIQNEVLREYFTYTGKTTVVD